jgi:hypothetical protein
LQDGPEKWATNSPKPAQKTGDLTSKRTLADECVRHPRFRQ